MADEHTAVIDLDNGETVELRVEETVATLLTREPVTYFTLIELNMLESAIKNAKRHMRR